MRIAFVVHDYHRSGGQSRYVAELATRFSDEHEVHVFANGIERNGEQRVIFHKVPALRTNALTTVLSFAGPAILQVGRGFDVVHCQGFCGPRGNVITSHICNAAWGRSLEKFAGALTLRERIFHFCASNLEKQLYHKAFGCAVIAVSDRVAHDMVEYYGCPAPIYRIYHGVDLERFSPALRSRLRPQRRRALGLPETDTVFLYVGDLRKGARQCIRALARLTGGRLVFLSRSAPEPYEELARELGIAGRLQFCPPTDRVEEFYAAADALLLPSPYDAFAMVVTEAMACALPVIVSRQAGAAELIEDRVNGLLLGDASDDAELERLMDRIQRDPSWAAGIGQAARATVERYSWDAVARQTMSVYEQIVARRN